MLALPSVFEMWSDFLKPAWTQEHAKKQTQSRHTHTPTLPQIWYSIHTHTHHPINCALDGPLPLPFPYPVFKGIWHWYITFNSTHSRGHYGGAESVSSLIWGQVRDSDSLWCSYKCYSERSSVSTADCSSRPDVVSLWSTAATCTWGESKVNLG